MNCEEPDNGTIRALCDGFIVDVVHTVGNILGEQPHYLESSPALGVLKRTSRMLWQIPLGLQTASFILVIGMIVTTHFCY